MTPDPTLTGHGVLNCRCGWTDTFSGPLVVDMAHTVIDGTLGYLTINVADANGKRIVHGCA